MELLSSNHATRMPMWLTFTLLFCSLTPFSLAQTSLNGQIFTNGLLIIDSPSSNTPFYSSGNVPIALEVSGNGKLPPAAYTVGSGLATRYDGLQIYLLSSDKNLTVATEVLGNSTETVRHINYNLNCTPSGSYNLTFYETSLINGIAYFTITGIPIEIMAAPTTTNNPSQCAGNSNSVSSLYPTQPSSPFSQSPFIPGRDISVQTTPLPSTISKISTTVTYTTVSTATVTTTNLEQKIPITSTFTTTLTTTAVVNTELATGFMPVNNVSPFSVLRSSVVCHLVILCALFFLLSSI